MANVSFKSLCEHYLSRHLFDSAKFYAERAYYDCPSPDNLLNLARCYFQQGKIKQTYLILQETVYSACQDAKYLFATACLGLDKHAEAEGVLTRDLTLEQITAAELANTPGGAAGVYLLGKICRKQQRMEYAKQYYTVALQMDPYLWEAIVDLSEMGLDVPITSLLAYDTAQGVTTRSMAAPSSVQSVAAVEKTYNVIEAMNAVDGTPRTAVALGLSTMSIQPPYTPGQPSPISRSMLSSSFNDTAHTQTAHKGPRQLFGPTPASGVSVMSMSSTHSDQHVNKRVSFGPSRLSFGGALDHGMYSPIYEDEPSILPNLNSPLPPAPSQSLPTPAPPVAQPLQSAAHAVGPAQEEVQQVVQTFATAIQYLFNYMSIECISALYTLPAKHLACGYAMQLLGKAYIDINNYKLAVVLYRKMQAYEPYRVQGMEYYSTALWHLKKQKELSALAQGVYEVDKYSPEAYCVLGNLFSLLKETELSLKYFHRAIAINSFVYAYTLAGHEYIYNDNIDQAIDCFNQALLGNKRHYNAFFGLGSIYYKQEKYHLAEYYFLQAKSINTRSSVLDCYFAMALSAQGTLEKITHALEVLDTAIERDGNNPQLRFQKAHILMSQDIIEGALEELLIVESFAPQEPPVHALLAQVYQSLGRTTEALKHLNIAMDLDPKEAQSLKAVMDGFQEPESTVVE